MMIMMRVSDCGLFTCSSVSRQSVQVKCVVVLKESDSDDDNEEEEEASEHEHYHFIIQ